MNNISIIMPVIGAVGSIIILAILLIVWSMEKREKIRSIDVAKFNSFVEEIKNENAQMKNDLRTVKEKVEGIEGMMKDI